MRGVESSCKGIQERLSPCSRYVSLWELLQASVAPCKGIRIPDSSKFWLVESGMREILSCGIRNPGFWNPECSLRNSE